VERYVCNGVAGPLWTQYLVEFSDKELEGMQRMIDSNRRARLRKALRMSAHKNTEDETYFAADPFIDSRRETTLPDA